MAPPKSSKYLYTVCDYENFEFRSPVDPWNPQKQYSPDFDKIKEKQDERNNVMTNQQSPKKEIARPNIASKTAYTTTNKAPNP
jgi:hypothetical protein